MGLELPFGIKPTNPVFVEETRGPYTTVAAAKAAIPQAIRLDGLTVKITGDGEYWWLGTDLTDVGLIKKQEGGSGSFLRYAITGNGTTVEFTYNHNLNNRSIAVVVSEGFAPNYEKVFPRIFHLTDNSVKLIFQTAPILSSTYNVLLISGSGVGSGSGGGAGATNLDALTDVIITTPSANQTIKFNGTNWVNVALLQSDVPLTSTRIPFGSTGNTLSENADLTWNDATKTLQLNDAFRIKWDAVKFNASIGKGILTSNTTGTDNIGISHLALNANTAGAYNIGIGTESLSANTIGTYNIGLGAASLTTTTTGLSNIGLGFGSQTTSPTASNELVAGSSEARILKVYIGAGGNDVSTTTYSQPSVNFYVTPSKGLNQIGGSYIINGGQSTGSGVGGNVILTTSPASASSSTANTPVQRVVIDQLGNATLNGQKEFRFNNNGNTFYTSLKTGANTANLNLTLPIIDGTSGQVLATDGLGNLSFITSGGSSSLTSTRIAFGSIGNTLSESADLTWNDATKTLQLNNSFRIKWNNTLFNTSIGLEALPAVTSGNSNLAIGSFSLERTTTGNYNIGLNGASTTSPTASSEFVVGNEGSPINKVYFGAGGSTFATHVQSSVNFFITPSKGLNIPNGSYIINGGQSTGSGVGGSVILTTSPASASSSTTNVPIQRVIIDQLGNLTLNGQKELRFNNSGNDFYTSLKTGANTANLNLTLPIADGTAGQVLSTNGLGVLGFSTVSGGGSSTTLTGDVTGTGTGTVPTVIANSVVTYAKMQNVTTARLMGRITAAAGVMEELTGTQATSLLDNFTTATKGLVPAPVTSNTTDFLRRDGTWAAPAGSGGTPAGANTQIQFNNAGAFGANDKLLFNNSTNILTVGNGAVNPQIKFNYTATGGGGDFTSQLNGSDQLSFGFNSAGAYGGTNNTESGRNIYFLDRISLTTIAGFGGAARDFYIGSSSTNFSNRFTAPAVGNINHTIKAIASQTADLTQWQNSGGTVLQSITPNGVTFINNAITIPSSNPASGGFLYVEAGSLKFRGSSGTITILGAA